MEIFRFSVVIMVLTGSSAFSAMSPYEEMQCKFIRSDEPDSCLLGSRITACGAIKCLKTVGQTCSSKSHEFKVKGNECGKDLICECDSKCSGCMTVNGVQKCHYPDNCLPQTFDYHDRMVNFYS